jgi:hypothetical protein
MRIAVLVVIALAATSCADGPSPRQKYGATYGVTGSNVPKKDVADTLGDVYVYPPEALANVQNSGSGAARGDPNAAR